MLVLPSNPGLQRALALSGVGALREALAAAAAGVHARDGAAVLVFRQGRRLVCSVDL